MRIFRPKYRDRKGKKKQVRTFWVEFRGPDMIVRKFALGTTDQDVADITKSQLSSLNEWAKKKLSPPDDLIKWARQQELKLRNKIYETGLLQGESANETRPLSEHLKDYIEYLMINSKSNYPEQVQSNINRIINGCGFNFWSDVEGYEINEFISSLMESGMGRNTAQHYIGAFRYFANWLKKQSRINEVPVLQSVKYTPAEPRAFELDEWRRLLKATKQGPARYGLSGHERYVLYKLAVETGLRRDELRSLTTTSFDFRRCTVFVPGKYTKNGKDALQNITPETADLIKELVKGRMPSIKVFRIDSDSAVMIRQDCEAAGIETKNYKGRINFHSCRHSCGTFLAAQGVHPKVAQTIMRHADINLTMSLYTHVLRGSEAEAINKFRKLEEEPKRKGQSA